MQKSLEEEAQKLLNLVSTVSSDIHRLPKDNLNDMLETLNVSEIAVYIEMYMTYETN